MLLSYLLTCLQRCVRPLVYACINQLFSAELQSADGPPSVTLTSAIQSAVVACEVKWFSLMVDMTVGGVRTRSNWWRNLSEYPYGTCESGYVLTQSNDPLSSLSTRRTFHSELLLTSLCISYSVTSNPSENDLRPY